ncbi:MAG: protein kinase [Deltaproteobacteria bacterium]|nr:protein kinase [Deltaproteobacteria bacterium]
MTNCVICSVELQNEVRFCPACGAEQPKQSTGGDDDDPFIGQVVNRNFRIDSLLGVGGMGKVYKARQLSLDKDVVIKILHDHFNDDPQLVQRFQREARAASRLSHPNSIQVIDFGQDANGVLFMAIEFLNGRDLYGMLTDGGPFEAKRLAKIMIQVCSALAEAHEQNVIHRDLKPENIMIVDHRGTEFVKVLDFGIAKIQDSDEQPGQALTQAGMVCGTPEYMSPEQARGLKLDHRSDLYALGVVVYQLATGELPFNADTPIGIVTKQILEEPTPPRERVPHLNIHPSLEAVILKAMSKKTDERYQTSMEMVEAFEELLRTFTQEEATGTTPNMEAVQNSQAPTDPAAAPAQTLPTPPQAAPPQAAPPQAAPPQAAPPQVAPPQVAPPQVAPAPAPADLGPTAELVRDTVTTELVDPTPPKKGGSGLKFAAFALVVLMVGAGGAVFLLKDQLFTPKDVKVAALVDAGVKASAPSSEAGAGAKVAENTAGDSSTNGSNTSSSSKTPKGVKKTGPKKADKKPRDRTPRTPRGEKKTPEKDGTSKPPKMESDNDKKPKIASGTPSKADKKKSRNLALKAQTQVFGNPGKAYKMAQEALSLDKRNYEAIKVMAVAHKQLGRKEKACRAIKDYARKKKLSKSKGLPLLKMVGGRDACGVR